MGDKAHIQHLSRELIQTIQDLAQYISHQQALGNRDLKLSQSAQTIMATWGLPFKKETPFLYQGPENARVFMVDSKGSFFSGEAGALLKKILKAMNLGPDSVFICNAGDLRSLHTRIQNYQPSVVVTLGQRAGQLLLNTRSDLDRFQGKFHSCHGVLVMPTFHPSTLLAQPELKRKVWTDMQQVMKQAGLADHV